MKRFLAITCAITLVFAVLGTAHALTVNFDEVILPTLTPLDGTIYYEPYGISFTDETFYAVDPRFAEDDYGITTTGGSNNFMSVIFSTPVPSVDFTWVTITGNDFNATAFDSADNIVSAFSVTGLSDITTGTGSLSSNDLIAKVTFSDGTGRMGVDSLTYNHSIPDPAAMFLLGSACLVGFGGGLRRKFKG